MKDDLERQLSIMVCAGDRTLKSAHETATEWRAAYKKWINGKGLRGPVATREAQMRLKLERGDRARRTGNEYGVFDETTGKCVGTVSVDRTFRDYKSYPARTIRCSTPNTSASSTRTWNA
jgi:hypothetical protein